MARGVVIIITASDTGTIRVDIRGPVKGKEGIVTLIDAARSLVERGSYSTDRG